ncbi:phage structural protein [Streptococcus suis]|uniref:Phage structural protein n=2 Tax=Streptococcus suis TaxID=1307 RepID=A0A123TKC0_STRSU|nr:phage structural protein [Streptococcus suis]
MDAGWNIEFGNTYGNTVTVTCDGQSQTLAVGPLYLNGSKKYLGSVQFRVGHNADGTKSAGIGLNSNMSNISYGTLNFGNASGNWVHGLTTIPRSSSVSVSSGVIGSALTININRQSSSFKHIVRYAWGNKSGTIATNVDTSTTWTIPLDFANDIPNSTSGTGTIYVDTYSGSTKTGTQQVAFIANVPASMKPTFSGVTLTDTNGAARSLLSGNNFLQIISNIQVNFNGASGSYSSTITGYKAEIVNRNLVTNSNGGTLGIMNFSGSATIRASVVDSRGRWSDTRDVTINVIEYFAPVLSFTAQRTRQTPNIIQIVRNAKIASITLSGSQKNIMTLSFKVAPLGSASYTADNGSASGSWTTQHTLNNSPANMAGSYPANKSFTIIGTLSDKFTSVEFSATVATESVVMSYDKDGRVGVGKIAENGPAGSLDVAGNIYAGNNPIQQHQLTSNAGRSPYNAPGTLDLNTKTINEFFACNEPVNGPVVGSDRSEFYVAVYSESDNYLSQNAIQKGTGRMFTRTRHGGTWTPWVEYATTNHPMLQEKPLKTLTMGFPYGLNATLIRKDSLVTITLNRRITNIDVFEYSQMVEIIPSGYRPTVETHMLMAPNVGSFTKSPSVLHFASDGKIRLTNGTGGAHVYTGTITYITNDPYPA